MWNYAQHFAMSDNSYSTGFGPSTPGLLNLVSGQTNCATNISAAAAGFAVVDGCAGSFTVISDPDPLGDVCTGGAVCSVQGHNVGDLLSAEGVICCALSGAIGLN